jgi:hypothetical protein
VDGKRGGGRQGQKGTVVGGRERREGKERKRGTLNHGH